MPETSESVTPPLIKLAPPLSVRVSAVGFRLLVLTGVLKETLIVETAKFRGLGDTVASDVIKSGCTFVSEKEAGAAAPAALMVTTYPPAVLLAVAVIAAVPLLPIVAVAPRERPTHHFAAPRTGSPHQPPVRSG